MTRINSGVHPSELIRQSLIAEHKEITRIPNVIRRSIAAGRGVNLRDQPAEFKLNTGHVRFFYDKLAYLRVRYCVLYFECVERGYNVSDKSSAFDNLPSSLFGHWRETLKARNLIIQRIHKNGLNIETPNMVRICKVSSLVKQSIPADELYGSWPLHGMPDGDCQPVTRHKPRKKATIDKESNQQLANQIADLDNCCE